MQYRVCRSYLLQCVVGQQASLDCSSHKQVMAVAIQSFEALNETNLQDILQSSLASPSLKVISIKDPGSDLGSKNVQYGSVLKKLVVLVSENGVEKEVHMIAKSALTKGMISKISKLGMFVFHREALFFKKALPMLLENLSSDQSKALLNLVPKSHYVYSDYEDTDIDDCMFRNIALCFCCILPCRKRERGFILMENLKEGDGDKFIDMKEIEKKVVTVEYMSLALDGLAHFHGAWWLWLQKADEETKQEICSLYKTLAFNKWEWALKPFVNMTMEIYIDMLEARKEDPEMIEKIKSCKNSPDTVRNMVKGMHDYEDSKFKNMIHWDLCTPRSCTSIMKIDLPSKSRYPQCRSSS